MTWPGGEDTGDAPPTDAPAPPDPADIPLRAVAAPYSGRAESLEYAEGVEVRRVRSNGEIKWAGERVN